MLAMVEKSTDYTHDIAYYAKDSRLTEPSDGKRYEWRKMTEQIEGALYGIRSKNFIFTGETDKARNP